MYTSHGHHIGGTPMEVKPAITVLCGGPKKCDQCFSEALSVNTRMQMEAAGGSMFMSPYQMHQVADKIRKNNPAPDGGMLRSEYLLSKTLYEFAKALDEVAEDIETMN